MSADPAAFTHGQNVKLVCAMMRADYIETRVHFVRFARNSAINTLICGTIIQYSSHCQVKILDPKYLPSCGSGTKTTTSKIKKYGLDILGMEVWDFTQWWCENNMYNPHNRVTLTEISKYQFSLVDHFISKV